MVLEECLHKTDFIFTTVVVLGIGVIYDHASDSDYYYWPLFTVFVAYICTCI